MFPRMNSPSPDLLQLLHDRMEIADALSRYAFGLDHNNAEILSSALTEDCSLDFSRAALKLGLKFPILRGRDQIIEVLIPMLGPLDTSHSASNLQIEIRGDEATLHGYIASQHFMPGQGSKRGSEFALLMNRYDGELVRDGSKWRFRKIAIDNAWADGDPEIITALATHRVTRAKS